MINFTQGYLVNKEGKSQDIVVSAKSPVDFKGALVGGILIAAGIIHLTISAFKKGSKCYENAETKTMCDLGIMHE